MLKIQSRSDFLREHFDIYKTSYQIFIIWSLLIYLEFYIFILYITRRTQYVLLTSAYHVVSGIPDSTAASGRDMPSAEPQLPNFHVLISLTSHLIYQAATVNIIVDLYTIFFFLSSLA